MLQVQTTDWKNFALVAIFTRNDWTYVALLRLLKHHRNTAPSDGEVIWMLKVDHNDSGGSVNTAMRVIAALALYISIRDAETVVRKENIDLEWLRRETRHTGVLQFTHERPERHPYFAVWLGDRTE